MIWGRGAWGQVAPPPAVDDDSGDELDEEGLQRALQALQEESPRQAPSVAGSAALTWLVFHVVPPVSATLVRAFVPVLGEAITCRANRVKTMNDAWQGRL